MFRYLPVPLLRSVSGEVAGGKTHKPGGGSGDPARAATLVAAQTGCSGEKFSTKQCCGSFSPQTLVSFVTPERTTFGLSDDGQQERKICILLGDPALGAVIFRL